MVTLKKGDFVRVEYIGRVKNGDVFDTTSETVAKKAGIRRDKIKYGPTCVVVGAEHLLPALDKELLRMSLNQERDFVLEPSKAFGVRDPKLVRTIHGKMFKEKPFVGMIVSMGSLTGKVLSVSAGRVRLDFNHPLAGKTIEYKLKVLGKVTGVKEQVECLIGLHAPGLSGKDYTVTVAQKKVVIAFGGKAMKDKLLPFIKEVLEKDVKKYTRLELVEFKKLEG